ADARLAGVGLGAAVAVVAGHAVGLGGIGAGAVGRVADAGIMALIERGADDRVRARADAGLAGVALRTGVPVVAGRAVGVGGVGAGAGGRVAGAGVVALVEGGADDRIGRRAGAGLAGVALRAGVAVVAGHAVGLARVRARTGGGVAGAGVVTLVEGG